MLRTDVKLVGNKYNYTLTYSNHLSVCLISSVRHNEDGPGYLFRISTHAERLVQSKYIYFYVLLIWTISTHVSFISPLI